MFCQGLFLGFLQFEIDKHVCFFCQGLKLDLGLFLYFFYRFSVLQFESGKLFSVCILSGFETGPRPSFLQFESGNQVCICTVRV